MSPPSLQFLLCVKRFFEGLYFFFPSLLFSERKGKRFRKKMKAFGNKLKVVSCSAISIWFQPVIILVPMRRMGINARCVASSARPVCTETGISPCLLDVLFSYDRLRRSQDGVPMRRMGTRGVAHSKGASLLVFWFPCVAWEPRGWCVASSEAINISTSQYKPESTLLALGNSVHLNIANEPHLQHNPA